MQTYSIRPIGFFRLDASGPRIELHPAWAPALQGLCGFSHVQVIWLPRPTDAPPPVLEKPYAGGPDSLGLFATRSPGRPNPIALSTAGITGADVPGGILHIDWLDADPGTPIADLKPYIPSLDRVETPATPAWCAHWPASVECSGDFDWSQVFTF